MSTPMGGSQADIVRLTKAASEAAQQGRWDEVIRCYGERGALLASTSDVMLPIDELLRMDNELRDRIHTAQIVLDDLLAEAQTTKRQVQGLRQRLAPHLSGPEAVSIEA
jgi:Ser-tRNA(Ala) deacylase AlaX